MTAAEEDRIRRSKAFEEAAKVRHIYEELVLKKPTETVVQIGSMQQISDGGSRRNGEARADRSGEWQWQRPHERNGAAKVEKPEAEAAVAGD